MLLVAAAGLLFGLRADPAAHDIPSDVTVQAFARPEGDRLRLLVRVPLEAMQDVNFPLRGPGYLDLEGAEPLLPDAAQLWLAQEVELYEDGVRLAEPEIAALRLSLPSDRSFQSYDTALANILTGERLPDGLQIIWRQAMLDVVLDYAIASEASSFAIRPGSSGSGCASSPCSASSRRRAPSGRSSCAAIPAW